MAEVVILIVGYRNAEDIGDCLRALSRSNSRPTFDVYIAENGGAAGMDALIALLDAGDPAWTKADNAAPPVAPDHGSRLRNYRLAGREDCTGYVHVAKSSENFGYAGGVNVWLRPLLADHGWNAAWILNPDTKARPDSLAELAAYSSSRNKGMVGSLIVRDDDPDVVMMRGLAWRKWTGRCIAVGPTAIGFHQARYRGDRGDPHLAFRRVPLCDANADRSDRPHVRPLFPLL